MDDPEVIREFLIESNENLAHLDYEIVELEHRPRDPLLLASIFRTIHTIKGTCSFLGFAALERITHLGESLLSQVRDGERDFTPFLVSLILQMVDGVRLELDAIERCGRETGNPHVNLIRDLQAACQEAIVSKTELNTLAAAIEGYSTRPSIANSTIRVEISVLDRLSHLVGELSSVRDRMLLDSPFHPLSQRLDTITTHLQEGVRKTRMQPIGVLWSKLPRLVRDLSTSCSKQITIEMHGAEIELDKSVIEAIADPLHHIVRNCCDHGIESPDERLRKEKPPTGRITLRAFQQNGQVYVEVSDDGCGVDAEQVKQKAIQSGNIREEQAGSMSERDAIKLIFRPGFTTAAELTNTSGRGVGLDIVKTNIERIGGVVDILSRVGQGTTVRIKIPLPATALAAEAPRSLSPLTV